jgi:dephospho-CoA kinase
MAAGKDSVADILCAEYGFKRLAFADKIKEAAKDLFPEEFKDGTKPRKLLQDFGLKMREIRPNVWVDYLMDRAEKNYYAYNQVITDCRYLNEIQISKGFGFIPVRVECDDKIRIQRLTARDGKVDPQTFFHVSETELDKVNIDKVIKNNGDLNELQLEVDALIENCLKRIK